MALPGGWRITPEGPESTPSSHSLAAKRTADSTHSGGSRNVQGTQKTGATRQLATSQPANQTMRIRIEFSQLHQQKFSQMEASLLMSLVSELNALNLLTVDIPPIKISEYGNYALEADLKRV